MIPNRREFSATFLAGMGAIATGALAGCASTQAPASAPPALAMRQAEPVPQVGQSFTFREINLYNKQVTGDVVHRVVQSDPAKGIAIDLLEDQQRHREIFVKPWIVLQEAHHDAALRFEQPVTLIPPQLTPGLQIIDKTRYVMLPERLAGGDVQPGRDGNDLVFRDLFWHVYTQVLGWETVAVPAGRFEVARVQRRVFFKHFDTFRIQSTRTETLWYAPSIGHWVAREWTGEYLVPGARRRSAAFREDWVRWELLNRSGPPQA